MCVWKCVCLLVGVCWWPLAVCMHAQTSLEQNGTHTGYFEALASLLKTEAPSLCAQATFIFVPGPHDPGMRTFLHYSPMPRLRSCTPPPPPS